jgi:hypothetical protein
MSTATTSTNTPYSGNQTSSAPSSPSNYVPTHTPQTLSPNESGFTAKEVLLYGGGLVLTAVITYFSTLISVNSEISSNKENISILKSDVSHLQGDLKGAEKDIAKNETIVSKVGIIEVEIKGLEKQLDAHIGSANKNKGITSK